MLGLADRSSSTSYAWAIRSNLPNPGSCFENPRRSREGLHCPDSLRPCLLGTPDPGNPEQWESVKTNHKLTVVFPLLCFFLSLSSSASLRHRPGQRLQSSTGEQVNRWRELSSNTGRTSLGCHLKTSPRPVQPDLKHACNPRHTPFGCNICQTHITLLRPTGRGPCHGNGRAKQNAACDRSTHSHSHNHTIPRLGISCLQRLSPHTWELWSRARQLLLLGPSHADARALLTAALTEPGPLPCPALSTRLSRAQLSCR